MQRLRRQLMNRAILVRCWYRPVAEMLLQRQVQWGPMHLLVDATKVGFRHQDIDSHHREIGKIQGKPRVLAFSVCSVSPRCILPIRFIAGTRPSFLTLANSAERPHCMPGGMATGSRSYVFALSEGNLYNHAYLITHHCRSTPSQSENDHE